MPRPVATPAQPNLAPQPTIQPKPLSKDFQLSPHTLRKAKCSCARTMKDLTSVQDLIQTQSKRLDKVWQRVTSTALSPGVREAGERICHELRASGWELPHIAGHQSQALGTRTRSEISLLWLVPAPDEEIGHRVLTEMVVELHGHGKWQGTVKNIGVRFATDWTDWADWTGSKPNEYLPETENQGVKIETFRGKIPVEGMVTDEMGQGKVWMETIRLLGQDAKPSAQQFTRSLGRASEELSAEGRPVRCYVVENVNRLSHQRKIPAIRVALHLDDGELGASLITDRSVKSGRTKQVRVVYEGECPITHHYRETGPPTDLEGLKELVKNDEAQIPSSEKEEGTP